MLAPPENCPTKEADAARALSAARVRLILGREAKAAFFASLALRLTPVVDWTADTAWTDGRRLGYNPDFVLTLTPDELVAVVCHEVMHLALKHHTRRQGRDPERWNEACDCAINPLLIGNGFTLPAGCLMPGEGRYAMLPPGKSAEEYYALLPEGTGPKSCGEVREPGPDQSSQTSQESEWDVAVAQAEKVARQRGELPAGLARTVEKVLHPPADWQALLREFVSATAKNDYSWSKPNRRFIAQGLYLPGLRSEELGEVVVAVDTSGSIGEKELALFGSELDSILSAFDCSATVLYHDSAICKVDEWKSADGPFTLDPVGGGGTSHRCVFEWIEQEGRSPACILCLTDMESDFPEAPPAAPVLWAVIGSNEDPPPFGTAVRVAG